MWSWLKKRLEFLMDETYTPEYWNKKEENCLELFILLDSNSSFLKKALFCWINNQFPKVSLLQLNLINPNMKDRETFF